MTVIISTLLTSPPWQSLLGTRHNTDIECSCCVVIYPYNIQDTLLLYAGVMAVHRGFWRLFIHLVVCAVLSHHHLHIHWLHLLLIYHSRWPTNSLKSIQGFGLQMVHVRQLRSIQAGVAISVLRWHATSSFRDASQWHRSRHTRIECSQRRVQVPMPWHVPKLDLYLLRDMWYYPNVPRVTIMITNNNYNF